jgi:hypothetical protein
MSVCSLTYLSKDGAPCSFTNVMFGVLFNDTTTVAVLGSVISEIVEHEL